MTINEIYNAVKFFANKEQKGFVKPSEFNTLAKQAQLEVFNEKMDKIRKFKSAERTGTNYRASVEDPTDFLSEISNLLVDNNLSYNSSTNLFNRIGSDSYIEEIYYTNSSGKPTKVEIVSKHNINKLLRSNLIAPSIDYPVALLKSNGIEVFPTNITSGIKMSFYKIETHPSFGYVASGDDYVYNSSTSFQFELPESTHNDIIIKICKYIGINLRDAELTNYAVQTENQDYIKTK
tara:strand:+ start:6586 stop:7290 length:705 start_codon:yes stop_codon:yes gene_type:complete